MNTASLNLCKELYELSGWAKGDIRQVEIWGYSDNGTSGLMSKGFESGFPTHLCPAYDLGFLLRKLPDITITNDVPDGSEAWHAGQYGYYDGIGWIYDVYADTPEDVVCSLAITLFRNGILTKESEVS